jgi:hypothetical protein
MLLNAEAAARILGAVTGTVTVHDRGPVAVLKIAPALGTRLDSQGWLGHEGSFHPPDLSPADDSLPLAGPATVPVLRKSSGAGASARSLR